MSSPVASGHPSGHPSGPPSGPPGGPPGDPAGGPGLTPVQGTARQVLALLADWDATDEADPLSVRTSGSTGEPKRVRLSRAAMRASADATHARLGGPGQWVLALPPTHVAGLQVLFRSVRAATAPVLLDGGLTRAVEEVTGGRCYLSLVPTQLARLLEEDPAPLRRFSAVLVGGARLDPAVRGRAEDAGLRLVATYGMTETCGGCVYDGVPLDGVRVSIAADGRVSIAGPVLFDGYDGPPEQTARALDGGWFRTQDLGRLDEQGRLHVLGRADDVVVTGGVNVPAAAVAETLREHPSVHAAEVVGVSDEEWGDLVVAVVVGDVPLDELRDWVGERHPRAWAPRRVVPVEALPLLPNGKVDRLAVQRLAAAAP